MDLNTISFFKTIIIIIYICSFMNILKNKQIEWRANLLESIIPYNITQFIDQHKTITPNAASFFLEYNFTSFLNNYKFIRPNHGPIEYHLIFPFHSDGELKKSNDYRQYFNEENTVIKHYSKYLNNEDYYENDRSRFKILPRNYKEDKEMKARLTTQRFTLIYLITLTVTSSFILREIKAMSHPDVAFILFIDNKSNRTELYNRFLNVDVSLFRLFDNVYFIDSPRFDVGWGRINQALSQAVLLFAGIKYFSNSIYFSFHSETDYPIVPNENILEYLKVHYPNNYMEIIPKGEQEYKENRIKTLSFFINESDELISSILYLFPNQIIPSFKWMHGANWFTLTVDASKKIINHMLKNFSIISHLDYSFNVDEILFQTLVSQVGIPIINNYHRYIDWSKGGNSPSILDETQFNKIIKNPCNFWARKFNFNKSKKLLKMIDNHIIEMKKQKSNKICLD